MAAFLFLAQLLFLGPLVVAADTETCQQLRNATKGNFSVQVIPRMYQANTTYQVTIQNGTNTTANESRALYVLQVLSPWNEPLGQWAEGVSTANCSSVDTAILNSTQSAANWTSPGTDVSSVVIRVYIIFPEEPAEFRDLTLSRAPRPTSPPSTTRNSVPTVQGSSLFLAVLQLPLLLATSTLLS
ncbi:chromosome 24 C11orf34 [Willisornis vidua]|uniref:Placenta-expressed transcript 1 protein n=1 Tax=Willisornis vidua TaxID=1566151 RepID=A0ABQ9DSJ5_9PASS|nr:chromosome 24 C11orf34 [Willisornis vidua]